MIRGINGSTMVTLELATTLNQLGAKTTVYTCDYDNPAKKIFENQNIQVVTSDDNPKFKLNDFDYVWVHSQILPTSLIKGLSRKKLSDYPCFIFLHMSGMDWIPDEKPWIYNLENKLSSLSLFISEEVKQVNLPFLDSDIPVGFFRNPAPLVYCNRDKIPSSSIKKLLIVSSHPPKEVIEAKEILTKKHKITVTLLGEGQEKYELFSKQLLEQYDAVLTIAKTVPYCLISGTPVYIYDTFGGGPGWLNKDNFKKAKIRNFSGYQNYNYPNYEGGVFHYKKAEDIVEEIINGYQESLVFHAKNKEKFYNEFVINSVLPPLFQNIKKRKIESFNERYTNAAIAAEQFATIRFKASGILYNRDSYIHMLQKEKDNLHHKNQYLQNENSKLISYKKNTQSVFESKAYRLFNKALTPYKIIRKGLKK